MAIVYFNSLDQNQQSQKRSLVRIPASAALLVSFSNDSNFYDIFQNYNGFKAILGVKEMNDLQLLQRDFFRTGLLSSLSDHQTLLLSFHPVEKEIDWLMNIPFARTTKKEDLSNALKQHQNIHIKTIDTLGSSFSEIDIEGIDRKLYVQIENSYLMVSFSKSLLTDVLNKSADHLSDSFMDKFKASPKSNSTTLQLYINQEKLIPFISQFLSGKPDETVELFNSLQGMTGLDLNFMQDAMMFSGISDIEKNDSTYLSLFLDQEPVNLQLKNWVVDDVAFFSEFGISDYKNFHAGLLTLLTNRNHLKQIKEQFRLIEHKKNVVINDELLPVWGKEFAKITLNTGEDIGIIAVRDSLEFANISEKISTLEKDSNLSRFDHSNILYYAFGDPLKEFKRPYFTYYKGVLLIANNKSTIEKYLTQIVDEKLLVNNDDFKKYERLQSSQSNYTLFVHRENAEHLISRKLKQPYKEYFQNEQSFGFQKFYAFSLQLSGNNAKFISNLYGQFKNPETLLDEDTAVVSP